MTARDELKRSDAERGPKRTAPKGYRPGAARPAALPMVSDHAVLRYMERALDMDVEAVRETILTGRQKEQAMVLGSADLPIGGGLRAIVRGGRVVTIR